jgi:dimethylhistidine N-methyltransferase
LETSVPAGQAFIELGSGASKKTRVLLDQFKNIAAYIPTDISGPFLGEVAKGLRRDYPNLTVDPIVSDFSKPIPLPVKYATTSKTAFFPGSTIGNLPRGDAIELLQRVRQWPEITSFIVGADLIKDTDVLINAYDDSQGITAAFNKNILLRLNREIGATFDVSTFRHDARWNSREARIEMHLVSKIAQTVRIGAEEITFTQGESIHTENSHKYSEESLAEMAAQSGWKVSEFLTNSDKYFAVTVFTPI